MKPMRIEILTQKTPKGIQLLVGHTVYLLKEFETSIWNMCDGTRTVTEIVDAIAPTVITDYDCTREQVEAEITNFLQTLLNNKLIKWEA